MDDSALDAAIGDLAEIAVDGLKREARILAAALKGLSETEPGAAAWLRHAEQRAGAFAEINKIVRRGAYAAPTPATELEQRLVAALGIAGALAERAKRFKAHDAEQRPVGRGYATGLTPKN